MVKLSGSTRKVFEMSQHSFLIMTWDRRILPRRLQYLHIIRISKTILGAMKYIPTWTDFPMLVGFLWILLFLLQRPPSADTSSAALILWPSRIVWSARYCFPRGVLDAKSLIRVMQQSIRRSHLLGQEPSMLLMIMDWAISQTCSLTLLYFCCVVKPPFSSQIPMVSATHWLSPTPTFSAQRWTCRVSIWIILASAMTDFGNPKASHYMIASQQWSTIEWWISDAGYSKHRSGVFSIFPCVTQCGCRGEEGVSNVLEIASKVGRQRKCICGLWGVILIQQHHLGCYLARNQFAYQHLSALICQLKAKIHHKDN